MPTPHLTLTQQLAQRWREYPESLIGQPCPLAPPRLQEIADRVDAALLLSQRPELAQPITAAVLVHKH